MMIGLFLAALLVIVLVMAATKPDTFRIERTAAIQAPPEKIFPYIEDFHLWSSWSPYEKLDPAMKRTFSGSEKGLGAAYGWSGNKKAGEGRMEIVAADAYSRVLMQLDFVRPMASKNTAEFLLKAEGDKTMVTWAIQGPNAFISKVMGIFINIDKLVGKDFEVGLANLKGLAEKGQ